MSEAFNLLNSHLFYNKNQVLFIKLFYNRVYLLNNNTATYASIHRRNKLHMVICYVKDYFEFREDRHSRLSSLGY